MTLEDIMTEPPHGENYGRAVGEEPVPLNAGESRTREFLADGGWLLVEPGRGGRRAGGTSAHRGALAPEEYVDEDILRVKLEEHMGFSVEEAHTAYRRDALGGPVPITLRELRGRLDARLLALSRDGVNMDGLATVLDIHPMQFKRALSRARGKEDV